MYSREIERIIESLTKLPSVGPRAAARFAFYLANQSKKDRDRLVEDIRNLNSLNRCESCFKLSKINPCNICSDDTRKRDELADAARTDFYKAYDRGEPDQADIANASVAAGRRFQFAMQQLNLESLFGVAGISKPSKPVPGYEDWTVEKIGQKLQQHQNRKRYPDKELAKTYALSEKDYKRYSTAFQMARACEDVIVTRATSKAVKREVPGFIEHLWKKQGEREYAEDGTRMETAA